MIIVCTSAFSCQDNDLDEISVDQKNEIDSDDIHFAIESWTLDKAEATTHDPSIEENG